MRSSDGTSEQTIGQTGVPAASQAPEGRVEVNLPVMVGHAVVAAPSPSMTLTQGAFDIPASFVERMQMAEFLAGSTLLPMALRSNPANVMLIMHKALALNIPMSVAFEHLHVIDGTVGHSAELLRAMLHRHGHLLRWPQVTDKAVTGELILKHDPKNVRTETFTLADAQRMELTSKKNWQKDPTSMLLARCTTRLVSRHCPEVGVALGNLASFDFADTDAEPAAPAGPAPVDTDLAAELYLQATDATTKTRIAEIGKNASTQGLLEIAVGPDKIPLRDALMKLMETLSGPAEQAAK